MRKLLIRVPVTPTECGVAVPYEMFVRHLLDTDDHFTRTAAGIRAAVRIEVGIASAVHLIEEADQALLHAAAEAPTRGYPELALRDPSGAVVGRRTAARACLVHIDAIASATPAPETPVKEDLAHIARIFDPEVRS